MRATQRPQRALPGDRFRRDPRTKHGISRADADAILRAQGGLCAVCLRAPVRPVIDHDHEAAASHPHPVTRGCPMCIAGVICDAENIALGLMRDDPDALRRAADYVERTRRRYR